MNRDQQEFRSALGQFATGITVITTLDQEQQPVGFTANSFNSVSLDPPLVLWSLAKSASTYQAFMLSGHYGIHVLAQEQVELSHRFASPLENRFDGLSYTSNPEGVPLFDGCVARFECSLEHHYEGGDHTIFVGRVTGFTYDPEQEPLAYVRGRYARLD